LEEGSTGFSATGTATGATTGAGAGAGAAFSVVLLRPKVREKAFPMVDFFFSSIWRVDLGFGWMGGMSWLEMRKERREEEKERSKEQVKRNRMSS